MDYAHLLSVPNPQYKGNESVFFFFFFPDKGTVNSNV